MDNYYMNVFVNLIFSNYAIYKQKFNDSTFAYKQTLSATRQLLEHHNFEGFTNEHNIKDTMLSSFSKSNIFRNIFLEKFIDVILNSSPETQNEAFLYNAVVEYSTDDGR